MSATDQDEFRTALVGSLAGLGLVSDDTQAERMYAHYERMVEANRQFNLTRITTPADAAVKHFADSLTLLATGWAGSDRKLTVLDVGTGAGFPAVPLAIVCERWSILGIDGTGKKARFVASSAKALGLRNLRARHARVEDLARHPDEQFDWVIVRAVGKIPQLLPELAGVVRRGGSIVFYKTHQARPEVSAAANVATKLRLVMEMREIELTAGAERLVRMLVRYRRPA